MIVDFESQVLNSEQLKPAIIEYLFCNHTEANLVRVADAILESDGDIIAIEKIREGSFGMGTAEEKRKLSEDMTRFISSDSKTDEPASTHFQTTEPLFTKILDQLKGSDKRIVLIDMGTDHDGYVYHRNVQLARSAFNNYRYAENEPNPSKEHEDLLLDYQIAAAQSYEYRELVMQQQVTALASENPGKKITVMAGAMHMPSGKDIVSNPHVSSRLIMTRDADPAEPHTEATIFDQISKEIRTLRSNLGKFGLSVINNTISQQEDAARSDEKTHLG